MENYPSNVEPHDYVAHSKETGNLNKKETHNCASLQTTPIANVTEQCWNEIPQHYPFVLLDEFIIMPNHIHGIIIINKNDVETHDYASHNNKTDNCPSLQQWQENKFGVQSKNIPAIIRGFKSSVKRFANLNNIEFEWQSRYYDRIIRDEEEMQRTRIYINKNIENWREDENYLP